MIDSLGSGGAQRQMVELALGFKENGHKVSFLTYHNERFYYASLEKKSIQVSCIEEQNYLTRLIKMRRCIRRGNYNAVLSFLEASNFICELAGLPTRKWKLIVGERSANPYIKKFPKLRMYRWFHLLADYVVTNSHANREIVHLINPLLPAHRFRVIYNIVDLEKWSPEKTKVLKNDGKTSLVVAASHQYTKNLDSLVEAVNLLTDEEKCRLRIEWYGDRIEPPYFDSSFGLAQDKITRYMLQSIFYFSPARHDLVKIFQECDAVGLFSKHEGLPNVVCEAMACAKPIICTPVSDLPILLSHQSNLISLGSDVESIKKVLSHFLTLNEDMLQGIGIKNRILAEKYFNKSEKISAYLRLME